MDRFDVKLEIKKVIKNCEDKRFLTQDLYEYFNNKIEEELEERLEEKCDSCNIDNIYSDIEILCLDKKPFTLEEYSDFYISVKDLL